MTIQRRFRQLLLGATALAALSTSAFAQTAQSETATASTDGLVQVASSDAIATDAVALSQIVVTATKRETNLQETPIAISVVGGESLQARHVESLINLADGAVPSLRVSTFEARQSALTIGIRGIVPFDANQTARDQGVGVYIDGVYLGRQQGLNAALFDVQRVEVLRGPQGTLFGRNTEGGALSIVTKKPSGEFGGRLKVGAGNYGSYGAEIHQDFAEWNNLAIKIDGLVQHQDATTTNPMAGQAGWNQYHRTGGRITALYAPTTRFSAELSVDYGKDQNTPFFSQLVNYNPYGKRVRTLAEVTAVAAAPAGTINPLAPLVKVRPERQKVSDIGTVQQPSVDKTGGGMVLLSYKLTDNLELRSISAIRAVATNQWDNSGVEARNVFAPNATFGRYSLSDLYQRQVSQEFQAVGNLGDNFDYVAGFYYFDEHVKESAATPFTNQWNADGTAYTIRSSTGTSTTSAGAAGWEYGRRFLTRASFADAKSTAFYGEGTYSPIERLHLTVGGRFTSDKRDGTLFVVNGRATNFLFNYNNDRFDPMVNLAFEAASDVNLYAKYSTGFRAGGANSRSQTFTSFGPEEVKSYEVGAKMDLFERRLRLNLAAYHMDRTGTQTDFDNVDTTPGSPTLGAHTEETRNSPGTSKIQGLEAELTFRPTQGMTVGAAYAYTDVKIPDAPFPFTGNADVPQGAPFPVYVVYTPKHAASAYVDYEVPVGSLSLRAHLDANYAGKQFAFQTEFADVSPTGKLVQNVAVQTDSSFIVNANLALAGFNLGRGPEATISVWSRNLFNASNIYRISGANRGTIGDYANFNPPRTFGFELSIKY